MNKKKTIIRRVQILKICWEQNVQVQQISAKSKWGILCWGQQPQINRQRQKCRLQSQQGSVIFEEDSWSPKKSCMASLLLDHFYEKRTNNY